MPSVTLDNCDREPIHIPGFIQPHGALLAFSAAGVLSFRSANAVALLGDDIPALGEVLSAHHFSGYPGFHELIEAVREAPDGDVIPHAMDMAGSHGSFDVIAHRTDDGLLCEFDESSGAVPIPPGFAFVSHRAVERLKREQDVEGLLSAAVQELRRMTGFDRVMAYRFRHDDSGDVVAETLDPALEPFLGRRYPAGDIPAQARRLYVINTLRLIADVRAVPVPVESMAGNRQPLDMSHGVLRSVSPVHIEYLCNMGVGASMSVSIVVGGKLWGMLACHHMQPRRVSYTVRMACDVLAQVLAANLQGILAKQHAAGADAAASLRSRLVAQVLHANDITRALFSEAEALSAGFAAHGVVVADGGRLEVYGGIAPATGAALVHWLNERGSPPGRLVYMNALEELPEGLHSGLDVWCGMLALPFGAESSSWVLLLRKEQIETVLWGGKPEKEYTTGPLGPRLTPRGSFDLWRETVRGRAVPWSASDLENAQKLLDELVRADAVHAAEIGRARHQLMAMLGHDLRDPIQSISHTALLMQKRGDDGQLSARLQSSSTRMQRLVEQVMDMSRAHSGALSFNMQPLDLVVVVQQMLAESGAVHPGIDFMPMLPPTLKMNGDADRIAQVLSNLLSNAAHHGTPGEPVLVQLQARDGMAVLEVSNSGPAVSAELVATLFKPFKSAATKSVTNRNGLGLGLYIAEQVVRGHHGTLSYSYSEPYVTFTASFPLA